MHDFHSIYHYREHRQFTCIEFWFHDKKESIKNFFKHLFFCFKWKNNQIHSDPLEDVKLHTLKTHTHHHEKYSDQIACDLFKMKRVLNNEFGIRLIIKLNHYLYE